MRGRAIGHREGTGDLLINQGAPSPRSVQWVPAHEVVPTALRAYLDLIGHEVALSLGQPLQLLVGDHTFPAATEPGPEDVGHEAERTMGTERAVPVHRRCSVLGDAQQLGVDVARLGSSDDPGLDVTQQASPLKPVVDGADAGCGVGRGDPRMEHASRG